MEQEVVHQGNKLELPRVAASLFSHVFVETSDMTRKKESSLNCQICSRHENNQLRMCLHVRLRFEIALGD